MTEAAAGWVRYGNPAGDPSLRAALARRLADLGVAADEGQIVTTVGATHALDIVARTLLQPGDAVLVDEPGWAVEYERLTRLGMRLLPVPRGILANVYVPLADAPTAEDLHKLYADTYAGEPFVTVLPLGELATLAHVTHTNKCVMSLTVAGNMLIITSATDNLIKGASGQAVQNMNVMFGFEETEGLL